MSEDLTWRIGWSTLRADRVRQAAATLAKRLGGLTYGVDVEDADCVTLTFQIDAANVAAAGGWEADPDDAEIYTIELSFYDLDGDGCVMAFEAEWSDNESAWDAGCAIAEDLAELLGAELLDL